MSTELLWVEKGGDCGSVTEGRSDNRQTVKPAWHAWGRPGFSGRWQALKRLLCLGAALTVGFGQAQAAIYLVNLANNNTTVAVAASGDTVADSGGTGGNYGNSENNTLTLQAPVGQSVQVAFTAFATSAAGDNLTLYDGPDATYPTLGTFSVASSPGTKRSTGRNLTVKFVSDAATVTTGFAANITTVEQVANGGLETGTFASLGSFAGGTYQSFQNNTPASWVRAIGDGEAYWVNSTAAHGGTKYAYGHFQKPVFT